MVTDTDQSASRGPGISIQESARRLAAVRELIERGGYETLLVFANPLASGGLTYLTGYTGIFLEAWCVVTAHSCSLVVGPEYVHTGGGCWLDPDDMHVVPRAADLVSHVSRLLGSRTRVAVAGDSIVPWPLWQALTSNNPSIRFESTKLLDGLRSRKSQGELNLIREACRLADAAAETFASAVAPGVVELDLASLIEDSICRVGPGRLAFPTVLGSGPRSLEVTMLPTLRAIEFGDMVLLDCGARYSGYCSDIARSQVAGSPSKQQRDLLETVMLMYDESRLLLKPGTNVSEVHRRSSEVAKSAGYEFLYGLGHGIGCDVHEYPLIDATQSEVLLEEGMVVTIEPQLYVEGVGGVRLENTILITSEGPIELTGTDARNQQ